MFVSNIFMRYILLFKVQYALHLLFKVQYALHPIVCTICVTSYCLKYNMRYIPFFSAT